MSRYPRAARDARCKCISCNAPLTRTVGGEYVCVECGRSPIRSPSGSRYAHDGGATRDGDVVANSVKSPRRAGHERSTSAVDAGERAADSDLLLGADSEVDPTISFVFPTKNEEGGIGECIDRAVEAIEDLDALAEIVVSDSSTDRTPEIARREGAIVVEPDAPGYGSAYKYAFERVRGDVVVIGDADTTYDFRELPRLIEPLRNGEADIVLGSRFDGEIKPGAMPPLHRYVGNPLLTRFLNACYGVGVSDAHSGFRVMTRDAVDRLDLRSDGMEFASEMIIDATAKGLRIEEVPITYHPREGDAELDSLQDGWRHVRFMLTNAPTYLFTVPGIAFMVLGALAMSLSFFDVQPGPVVFGTHTMIAGSLFGIVGYQVFLLGVASSLTLRPLRRSGDAVTAWIEANFSLGGGVGVGLAMTGLGVGYAGVFVARWVSSGFTDRPLVAADMLAFTAIVVGLETLFNAFYLGAARTNRPPD